MHVTSCGLLLVCSVIEVAADAEELRLFEADILTLCGSTDLFQPPAKFTVRRNDFRQNCCRDSKIKVVLPFFTPI